MTVYTEAIQKLYVAYFSRPADVAGLIYWDGVVATAKGNTAAVSAAFAASGEYRSTYAGKDTAAVVDTVYMNLFGRHAEPAGVQYWSSLLDSGAVTVDGVVTAVAGSALTTDLAACTSKVAASTAFTAALDTTPEILAYSGGLANLAGVMFLAGVTDATSLAAATAEKQLAATIAAIVSPDATPTPAPAPPPITIPGPVLTPTTPPPELLTPTATGRTFDLGGGDDVLGDFAIVAGDIANGGPGLDTMVLNQVGAANALAFWNFERVDARAGGAFDLAMLAGRNTISEILVSESTLVQRMVVTNLPAGASLRASASQTVTEVTQVAPGPIQVTADIDEGASAPAAAGEMNVTAKGATALHAVFDSDFKLDRPGAFGANGSYLNGTLMSLSGNAAKAITVKSGGDFSSNAFDYTDSAAGGALTMLTITGERPLSVVVSAPQLALVDASTATGGLTIATGMLGAGGLIKLGMGSDTVKVSSTSTLSNAESISGLELTAAGAVGADAGLAAPLISAADKLMLTGATVANAVTLDGGAITAGGVLRFSGAGPASLDGAFAIANAGAETVGEAVVFEFMGDSYVFVQGTDDVAVKLVGLRGITQFVETGADLFFVV